MNITVRTETADELDAPLTSSLARRAFLKDGPELSEERFAWTYRQGYERATIVSAFADGSKAGQLACFFKTFIAGGQRRTAAELVDLFVSPEYRGFKVASSLYKEMQKVVASEGADIMYAYANEGASVLNKRFFGMEEVTQLPARLGFALPGARTSGNFKIFEQTNEIASACASCFGFGQGGVEMTCEELRRRISSPIHRYLCVTDGDTAILASPRVIRSLPVLLVCATFSKRTDKPQAAATRVMIANLCRTAGRTAFLYLGWNDSVGFSNGFGLPERLLKGKFLIQSNCLNSQRASIGRFEILDVDYA